MKTYTSSVKANHYIRLAIQNIHAFPGNDAIKNYLKYKIKNKLSGHGLLNDIPQPMAMLIVTKRCNLSCSFCTVGKNLNKKDAELFEMTLEDCQNLFATTILRKTLYVLCSGGEPLLNKNIFKITKFLKKEKRFIGLNTNGILLEEKMDDVIDAGIDLLNISLYPANKQKLWKILPTVNKKIHARINMVINRKMLESPEPIIEGVSLARETNCSGIYLANVLPAPFALNDKETDTIYDDEPLYDDLKKLIRAKFGKFPVYFSAAAQRTPKNRYCRLPWYMNIVDAKGNLALCCKSPVCDQENIYSTPQHKIKNTARWDALRKSLSNNKTPIDRLCEGCYILNDEFASDI